MFLSRFKPTNILPHPSSLCLKWFPCSIHTSIYSTSIILSLLYPLHFPSALHLNSFFWDAAFIVSGFWQNFEPDQIIILISNPCLCQDFVLLNCTGQKFSHEFLIQQTVSIHSPDETFIHIRDKIQKTGFPKLRLQSCEFSWWNQNLLELVRRLDSWVCCIL
jgi:hypothetical protein